MLFFQGINLDIIGNTALSQSTGGVLVNYLNITHIYSVKELGRIFTEKPYNLDLMSSFSFFSSSPSPPTVYEFLVDHTMNVVIQRVYVSMNYESSRYIGNDAIAINENFIALLIYDYKTRSQAIRIFYRSGSNFGIGHTDIQLYTFEGEISSIVFM